jgi:hypothetical protein
MKKTLVVVTISKSFKEQTIVMKELTKQIDKTLESSMTF